MELNNLVNELRDADIDRTYIIQVLINVIENEHIEDKAIKHLNAKFASALKEYRDEKQKEDEELTWNFIK